MTISEITEVWNWASILFAVLAGASMGYFTIGWYASNPAYASGEATPREYGLLTAIIGSAVGMIFFFLQILGTYLDGDPAWTRVVSRMFIWIFYCTFIGLGTWLRLSHHAKRKKAQAHARAIEALDHPDN